MAEIHDLKSTTFNNLKPKDCETASGNTEDSLLTTASNSISKVSSSNDSCCSKPKRRNNCCSYIGIATGIILTSIGILMLIWTPFDVLMGEKLNMQPGLPAFDWWKTPPDEVHFKVYVFDVTNADAFMNGTDEKLNMVEIGPITYLEKVQHINVTHNENGTMTYTAVRSPIYLPEYNNIDLNTTIIVPNYAVLGMASYLYDASFFTKLGFNMLLRTVDSPMFVNTTIYNFLWNLTDPILEVAKHFAPDIIQSGNIGMMDQVYKDFTDQATVYIGRKNGDHKFFLIDKYHGSEYLPGHGPTCVERVTNSTEGLLYPQHITRDMELRYWRKTVCKYISLYYIEDRFIDEYNVMTYKFIMLKDELDRKANMSLDCHKGDPILPNGIYDVSKCYHGMPMAVSFPHFLYGDDEIRNYVTGLKPNASAHESYLFVEPNTGIPIEATARLQSNMVVKDMSGFNPKLHKFGNTVLPMFWLEYSQAGLPDYVQYLLTFTVNILPVYQWPFIGAFLMIGCAMLVIYFKRIRYTNTINNNNNKKRNSEKEMSDYEQNVNTHFETDKFIKQ